MKSFSNENTKLFFKKVLWQNPTRNFLVNFCIEIRRALSVLARSKMYEPRTFWLKKFSVSLFHFSLEKDIIYAFIYM